MGLKEYFEEKKKIQENKKRRNELIKTHDFSQLDSYCEHSHIEAPTLNERIQLASDYDTIVNLMWLHHNSEDRIKNIVEQKVIRKLEKSPLIRKVIGRYPMNFGSESLNRHSIGNIALRYGYEDVVRNSLEFESNDIYCATKSGKDVKPLKPNGYNLAFDCAYHDAPELASIILNNPYYRADPSIVINKDNNCAKEITIADVFLDKFTQYCADDAQYQYYGDRDASDLKEAYLSALSNAVTHEDLLVGKSKYDKFVHTLARAFQKHEDLWPIIMQVLDIKYGDGTLVREIPNDNQYNMMDLILFTPNLKDDYATYLKENFGYDRSSQEARVEDRKLKIFESEIDEMLGLNGK